MSRKVRSTVVLLMLTLFLGTGVAQALPLEGPSSGRASGMLVAIWDWVTSLLGVETPFGQARAAASTNGPLPPIGPGSQLDGGGYIDPNGND
ncbi:MAG TPA: hypothetical protein VN493_28625 [Thermoanaerobaculia bacterium]|nr:hypothetical protein [Thermoanaerobaculia bacterium]